MSGPKMVGITCDPEVIARNNERLRQVGKDRYYSDIFSNINTDITNTGLWVKKYGIGTLNCIPEGYGDESGFIREIDNLKKKHIEKIVSQKINLEIILKSNPEELNKLGVQKVEDIPQWKEQFLEEISLILKKLQEDINRYNNFIRKNQVAHEEVLQELKENFKKAELKAHELDSLKVKKFRMERYMGNGQDIPFMTQQIESVDPETLPFTLEELALLEMLQGDLKEYSKLDYLEQRENDLIEILKGKMKCIEDTSETAYSMKSKRAVLQQMRLQYAQLDKYVSMRLAARNIELKERNTLEMEYISFCQALDINEGTYTDWPLSVLREKVNVLREEVEKQESRIYIEETIEDIMGDYGYSSISSYHLHDADSVSRIIFENSNGAKISTSFGDGMIMMNVIGEGDNSPTKQEVQEMVHQQEAFCDLYPQIKEQLLEKGIHINYEKLMPVSAEHTANEKIVRQKNIKKSTKKFSFRHVQLVSERYSESQFDSITETKLQYIDNEE